MDFQVCVLYLWQSLTLHMCLDPLQPVGVFFLSHAFIDLRAQLFSFLQSQPQVTVVRVAFWSVLYNLCMEGEETRWVQIQKAKGKSADGDEYIASLFAF